MNIIVASGGTLGHLTPILPIVKKLSETYNVYLITSKKLEFNHSFKKIYNIEASGISKNIIKFVSKNLKATKEIRRILKELKPSLIIGMGGYISGLVIRVGIKNKIKTIIHEQNSIMGLANKLVAKKVNLVIHSYFDLDYKGNNKIYLPNPRIEVAYNISKIYKKHQKDILIVSGTLGAKVINDLGINLSKKLNDYKFTLITGKRYYNEYRKYNNENLKVIPYTKNLIELISKSSVVVTRSGASTISEIIGTRTKAIYIPSINVTKNHQFKNTLYISKNKLGIVIEEKDLSVELLVNKIKELEDNNDIYEINLNKIKNNNIINKYIDVIKEVMIQNGKTN